MSNETIDSVHERIHIGEFFAVNHAEQTVTTGSMLTFLINVVSPIHINLSGSSGGDLREQLYEDATVSANGTALTAINHNRLSTKVTDCSAYSAPTVTDLGSKVVDTITPGGSLLFTQGANFSTFKEYILKPSNYILQLTNLSASTEFISVSFEFYQVGATTP